MTRSLIVGVDDSDDSRNALARAAELARAAGLLKAPSPGRCHLNPSAPQIRRAPCSHPS